MADFDKSDFGEALRSAAAACNGSYGYPTYVDVDTTGSSPEQISHEVFKGHYWGAIIVQPGSTDRFRAATNGTAISYHPSDVYAYYLLDARYYTFYVSNIQTTTIATTTVASGIFTSMSIEPLLANGRFVNTTAALSALSRLSLIHI